MSKSINHLEQSAPKMWSCTVRSAERLTPDSVLLTLDPGEHRERFNATPGQKLTFCLDISGQSCYRNYNLVNPVGELPQIAVKHVSDGGAAEYMNTTVRTGDVLQVAPPEGDFYPPALDKTAHHFLLFAAGSGITPLISIVQHALKARPDNKVTLFYANSSSRQIMFREKLDVLAQSSRLDVYHILGDGATGEDLSSGRLNPSKVGRLLAQYRSHQLPEQAFISGPTGFTNAVQNGIEVEAHPLDFASYSFERANRDSEQLSTPSQSTEVHLTVGGVARSIPKASQNLTLLESADLAGLDMPADCRSGICHRCKARIVSGRTTPLSTQNLGTQSKRIPPGYILCCQQKPDGPKLELEMD